MTDRPENKNKDIQAMSLLEMMSLVSFGSHPMSYCPREVSGQSSQVLWFLQSMGPALVSVYAFHICSRLQEREQPES